MTRRPWRDGPLAPYGARAWTITPRSLGSRRLKATLSAWLLTKGVVVLDDEEMPIFLLRRWLGARVVRLIDHGYRSSA